MNKNKNKIPTWLARQLYDYLLMIAIAVGLVLIIRNIDGNGWLYILGIVLFFGGLDLRYIRRG